MEKLLTQIGDEVRELTAEEIEQYRADQAEQAALAAEKQSAQEAKEAAQAKLTALGLTLDDLKALGL
jgi:hypothetical protein